MPLYAPLAPEEVRQIDHTSRQVLERVGVTVYESSCLETLDAAGACVDYQTQRVRFDGDWLNAALGSAPSQFVLYSRDGQNDIHLGDGKVYFTNGGRVFRIQDSQGRGYRYTMLRHVARTAALVNQLQHINFYIVACQAHALKPETYHLNDFYQAFKHTTKHVMGGCDDLDGVKQVWELASFIAGSEDNLREKPFVSVITNPVSPLTIEAKTLRVLRFCCTHGIPVTCAPAPIAGATAPATLAGTLVQMHAEALAGVAIAQALAPGAKVLYGAVPATMDLRNMEFCLGSVEAAMMNAAAVQLAKLYNLPIYASAGVTEAKKSDIQAGCEKTLSNLLVAMAGADCIHLSAGILDSGNTISYAQYVIDNEIIGMVQRVLSGIKVDQDTLALGAIQEAGPGGNYVVQDHTVKHMLDEFFYPALCVRSNFDIWEAQGCPDMFTRASDVARQAVEGSSNPILDAALVHRIKTVFPGIEDV